MQTFPKNRKWRVAGINFDFMHMGDLLGKVHAHPDAEMAAICDEHPEQMKEAVDWYGIAADRVFTDYRACLEKTKPDVVILCPKTAEHALWTENVAPYGVHVLMEKPFATSVADADRMIAALAATGKQLIINWPLRWYPSHVTAKRLLDDGVIGELQEVHYYDGNRGPLSSRLPLPGADLATEEKRGSWYYRTVDGGGALMDYLGYGTTLGTWYHGGKKPVEVTTVTWQLPGVEVDEHSVSVVRYEYGLSKFETRWGTFTNPWELQPQPKCGFVLKGSRGTLSSYDYEPAVRVQTQEHPEGYDRPVDRLEAPNHEPISYVLNCLEDGREVDGPLSPAISRIGQQIVDTAVLSSMERRTVALVE